MPTPSKKILLTTGRSYITLDLARKLHDAGHRVYIAETTHLSICRFSKAVEKYFIIPSPRSSPEHFIHKMRFIAETEKIDLIIPIFEEILHLAKFKDTFPCEIFCDDFEKIHQLHDKWLFHQLLNSLDIVTPKAELIRSAEDLEHLDRSVPYALKATYSRASLSVKKIEKEGPLPQMTIKPDNPWIAQEWIEGERFCSYTVCRQGKIMAHGLYPVGYTIDGNSCVVFKAIDHPQILEWIEDFVAKTNFTGQVGFDFIIRDGIIYAIECNPRATSGLHLLKENIDLAFFSQPNSLILAQAGTSRQIMVGMVMSGWRKKAFPNNTFRRYFKELISHQDVVLSKRDIAPFLSMPLVFAGIWKQSVKLALTIPATFIFDYEWNGDHPKAQEIEKSTHEIMLT